MASGDAPACCQVREGVWGALEHEPWLVYDEGLHTRRERMSNALRHAASPTLLGPMLVVEPGQFPGRSRAELVQNGFALMSD
jgi:hypothetical protein